MSALAADSALGQVERARPADFLCPRAFDRVFVGKRKYSAAIASQWADKETACYWTFVYCRATPRRRITRAQRALRMAHRLIELIDPHLAGAMQKLNFATSSPALRAPCANRLPRCFEFPVVAQGHSFARQLKQLLLNSLRSIACGRKMASAKMITNKQRALEKGSGDSGKRA